MMITDRYECSESLKTVRFRRIFPGEESIEEMEAVIAEHTMQVITDNNNTVQIVCMPENLPELVVGRLFTEGLICGKDDILQIGLNRDGSRADVKLKQTIMHLPKDQVLPDHSFCIEDVFEAVKLFSRGAAIYRKTSGTHSCFLIGKGGEVFLSREDIGRHNALDKVLGAALLNDMCLSDKAIFTSGRVPLDMVQKVIRAGIPLLISKSVPTVQSIEMAERYGLTLVTSAWPDNFRLMTGHL